MRCRLTYDPSVPAAFCATASPRRQAGLRGAALARCCSAGAAGAVASRYIAVTNKNHIHFTGTQFIIPGHRCPVLSSFVIAADHFLAGYGAYFCSMSGTHPRHAHTMKAGILEIFNPVPSARGKPIPRRRQKVHTGTAHRAAPVAGTANRNHPQIPICGTQTRVQTNTASCVSRPPKVFGALETPCPSPAARGAGVSAPKSPGPLAGSS